jgi:hypothetical protein
MANMVHKTPPSHRLTVSSLLSPPEMKRSESFGSLTAPTFAPVSFPSFDSQSSIGASQPQHFNPTMLPSPTSLLVRGDPRGDAYASPPISPYETQLQKENMEDVDEQGARDPQLFASGGNVAPATLEPLFPQEPTSLTIWKHMRSQFYADLKSKPSREDYELVVEFRSCAFESALNDPRAWRKRERKFEEHYGRPTGVQKRPALKALAPAPSSRPRQPKVAVPRLPPRAPRAPKAKRTPKTQMHDSFDLDDSTPAKSPKPARKMTSREDTDYNALPDYCPPLDTLPKNNPKCLKADWRGTVLDLSKDPDRQLLHEGEVSLAATLRLSCATYLCSKRRIFQARTECLKIGKEFRKTDAQQACNIDVNKASKLWSSYEKVGWFNPDHFRQYL